VKPLDIETSIKNGLSQAPRLDFAKLAATPVVKQTEHDYITRQKTAARRRPKYFKQFSSAVACCAIAVVCYSGWYIQFREPDSTVALDVNPSIEIVTNRHNQVLSVRALNDDAKKVVAGLDLNQADLDESVDALVSSMIEQGYLNADRNVVLVSVENKDADRAGDLAVAVDQTIKDSASDQDFEPTVLRQTLTETDQEAAALAEQYNVSTGKIKLVQEIANADETLTVDALAAKSVTELLQISKEKAVDLNKIVQFDDSSSRQEQTTTSTAATTTTAADSTGTSVTSTPVTTSTATVKEVVPTPTDSVTTGKTDDAAATTTVIPVTPAPSDAASANEVEPNDPKPVVVPPKTDDSATANESENGDVITTKPTTDDSRDTTTTAPAATGTTPPAETATVPETLPVE
jgi:hypothetical protein